MKKGLIYINLACLFFITGLIPSGCKSLLPQNLIFETIDNGDSHWTTIKKPSLVVVASLGGVDDPGPGLQFPPALAEKLRSLDYTQVFAVVVFPGKVNIDYDYAIQQVNQRGNQVTLMTRAFESAEGKQFHPLEYSPYTVIAISKRGSTSGQEVHLVLQRGSETIARVIHFIP